MGILFGSALQHVQILYSIQALVYFYVGGGGGGHRALE